MIRNIVHCKIMEIACIQLNLPHVIYNIFSIFHTWYFILYVVTIAFCERLSVSCIIYSHYVAWQLSVATLYHFVYHILTVHSAEWPPVWQSDSGKWWAVVVRSIKDLLYFEMSCSLSLLIFNFRKLPLCVCVRSSCCSVVHRH